MNDFKCVVCQKAITVSYFVCANCAAEYGFKYGKYPKWLRFLIKNEHNMRYSDERQDKLYDMIDNALNGKEPSYVDPHDEDRF